MYFQVLDVRARPPESAKDQAFLIRDRWNDWMEFKTQLRLVVVDGKGKQVVIGDVKIGRVGLEGNNEFVPLPDEFDMLDSEYFSLGQSEDYYLSLKELGDTVRTRILDGLNDVAADPERYKRVLHEEVLERSLLRDVRKSAVEGRLRRLAQGDATLTRYAFTYSMPVEDASRPEPLSFDVVPLSCPPTNVHVLIGRNGVGKTYTMAGMLRALVDDPTSSPEGPSGAFVPSEQNEDDGLFGSVVHVSFSAFDPYTDLPLPSTETPGASEEEKTRRVSYVGLKQTDESKRKWTPTPKTLSQLSNDFVSSAKACFSDQRLRRWSRALEALEADPVFGRANVSQLAERSSGRDWASDAVRTFDRLSSGHKIVLLTMTKLVETVEERTLVLLDEPEGHLHPPLLSAFVRALSDLLVRRNGVAIVSTHSPVVLQEVPKSCVWYIRRVGAETVTERPEIETFGENVGVLTREVFGLEVTQTGFHKMIADAVAEGLDYEGVMLRFGGQLGAEARSIARALTASQDPFA